VRQGLDVYRTKFAWVGPDLGSLHPSRGGDGGGGGLPR
jgi:hypothetical protein